jgi:hypothetical protein
MGVGGCGRHEPTQIDAGARPTAAPTTTAGTGIDLDPTGTWSVRVRTTRAVVADQQRASTAHLVARRDVQLPIAKAYDKWQSSKNPQDKAVADDLQTKAPLRDVPVFRTRIRTDGVAGSVFVFAMRGDPHSEDVIKVNLGHGCAIESLRGHVARVCSIPAAVSIDWQETPELALEVTPEDPMNAELGGNPETTDSANARLAFARSIVNGLVL